ncbi:hypothetical protein [Micromonospora zingiberis]|uniref:hypothetical protein n=1 Tax=Micromonospora zingiberis TaxID=2053011 RepID=UPI0013F459A7|nr:hypothetical protein [Micromonospora zingiberis]
MKKCGATNPTLGLRCDREPHPPGTAHYQDNGNGVRAWYEPFVIGAVAGAAPNQARIN